MFPQNEAIGEGNVNHELQFFSSQKAQICGKSITFAERILELKPTEYEEDDRLVHTP